MWWTRFRDNRLFQFADCKHGERSQLREYYADVQNDTELGQAVSLVFKVGKQEGASKYIPSHHTAIIYKIVYIYTHKISLKCHKQL